MLLILWQCKSDSNINKNQKAYTTSVNVDSVIMEPTDTIKIPLITYDYDTTLWNEIIESQSLFLDIKYATPNNLTKKKIYSCPRCFLRPHVARKLYELVDYIKSEYNLSVILYDCYRPRPYQQKLWDIVQDKRYVTPPEKGSMHNRGMAIDISLADSTGVSLDMGTAFDFFGYASFHNAKDISEQAINNRKILKAAAEKFGFQSITSEWWHYSYRKDIKPLDDWIWNCPAE